MGKNNDPGPIREKDKDDFNPEEIAEMNKRAEYLKAELIYNQIQREIAQAK